MMSEQRLRKFRTGDIRYPDMGSASDWLKEISSCHMTNQKHYADLGRDTSLVWNYCSYCSNVILQGIQWCVAKHWLFSLANRGK